MDTGAKPKTSKDEYTAIIHDGLEFFRVVNPAQMPEDSVIGMVTSFPKDLRPKAFEYGAYRRILTDLKTLGDNQALLMGSVNELGQAVSFLLTH